MSLKDYTKLDISGDYRPSNNDWETAGWLIGQKDNLTELRLGRLWDYSGEITRGVLEPLWKGIAQNTSITKLVLDKYHLFGGAKFFTILLVFFEQNTNLESLVICSTTNDINDKGAKALGKCLERSKSLTHFKIIKNTKISKKGWGSLFDSCLTSTHCKLSHLSLFESRIDDDSAMLLAEALRKNTSIKTLDLGKIPIKRAGWDHIFSFLKCPDCTVEDLRLHHNRLDSSATAALASSLAHNRTLKRLSLKHNYGWISSEWFTAFSSLLQSSNCGLEELNLSGISIDDKSVVALAWSLAKNQRLKRLLIGDAYFNMGDDAVSALSQLLCNKSSIMATYNSNHTLQQFTGHLSHYKVQPFLQLNRDLNKCVIRRRKILMAHFDVQERSGRINVQPFVDVELGVLPYAIAWMAKDCYGFSLLYEFLPVLFSEI
mmetsp:Transcript_14965/g.31719  ORF Transcript_14965/g.31719 Transcript_14965/m.31719 type:complete len:431 (+) Transcript_14965:90-1382(+)